MRFSCYFFHVNKDMITHRQAAHQSAEMGHEQEQQEPDSLRYAQTNTQAQTCPLKAPLSYIYIPAN